MLSNASKHIYYQSSEKSCFLLVNHSYSVKTIHPNSQIYPHIRDTVTYRSCSFRKLKLLKVKCSHLIFKFVSKMSPKEPKWKGKPDAVSQAYKAPISQCVSVLANATAQDSHVRAFHFMQRLTGLTPPAQHSAGGSRQWVRP